MIGEWHYTDITVGQTVEFVVQITEKMVADFAALSGDVSPLHVSEEYAATTPFGRRVVHGMLVGSLFSQLVGVHLPGQYAVYVSQEMQFRQPVFIGDTVGIRGTVIKKHDSVRMLEIMTEALVGEQLVVTGLARVKVLQ